jgi:Tol biopolymer transport system component
MLGTVGYMAPEQVVGQDVDGRADLFALGVVLCEMVTGVSPFGRATPVETLNAILKDEPSLAHVQMPGAAAAVVQALLAKDPDRRLRSADDAALMLGSAAADARKPPAPGRAPRRRRFLWLAVPMITVFAAAGWLLARSVPADRAAPVYARLTMLHGTLWSGRFAPDGQTIVYSASWENEPVQLFSTRIGSVETRPLGIHPASLLSISSRGEMALLLDPRWILTHYRVGTLARADLAGGAAREMATDVLGADWAPDGSSLAIVRAGKEDDVLEYPEGTAIYRAKGRRLHSLRVSPDGERIALFERLPESSQLTVVSRRGEATVLSRGWDVESRGLAWGPDGTEVWFSAARQSALRLMAVRLDGRERTLAEVPQSLELLDVARDGRVLVNHFLNRLTIYAGAVGGKSERIVSWLDGSFLHQISNDGNTIVFDDPRGLRLRVGQAAPVLLAPTDHWISWSALSPDGRHVAAVLEKGDAAPLTVIPTGPGPKHTISPGGRVVWAGWMDAARLVVATVRQGRLQLSRHDIRTDASDTLPVAGRTWEAIFDPQLGADMFEMSPDGRRIAIQARGEVSIVDLALGTLQRMPKTSADYSLAGWSDRDELLFYRIGDVPARVFRADIKIGVMHPWIELAPLDRSGLWRVHPVRISPKGSYAYLTTQYLSDLYLVTGLK